MFLLGTTSSARFKSPVSFSTRTRRPWQQRLRTRRCGRRAGHACALFVAHNKHGAIRTARARKVQSYLISYTGAEFLRIGTLISR